MGHGISWVRALGVSVLCIQVLIGRPTLSSKGVATSAKVHTSHRRHELPLLEPSDLSMVFEWSCCSILWLMYASAKSPTLPEFRPPDVRMIRRGF